ncbi:MAG: hypothetical protein ACREBU_02515 [Nitrososphaera sp.]
MPLDDIMDRINGAFMVLESTINGQMANRDHLLVSLTDGIVVIEPWSQLKKDLHFGMKKEIEYVSTINRQMKKEVELHGGRYIPKKMCIVLLASTVKTILSGKPFREAAKRALKARAGADHEPILAVNEETLINDKLDLIEYSKIGSLGPEIEAATLEKEIRPQFPNYRREVLPGVFIEKTLYVTKSELADALMLMIVDRPADIANEKNVIQIAKFLKGGLDEREWENNLLAQFS